MSMVVARSDVKRDGRAVSKAVLEHLRLIALARIHEGESPANVAASYGLHRGWAYKLLAKSQGRYGGARGLGSAAESGSLRRLDTAQERRLFGWVNGKSPGAHGCDAGLWTRKAIRELIEREFGVQLSHAGIGALLDRLGLTPQRPLQGAYRRDALAIAHWEQSIYPKIVREAKREYAELLFWTESGFDGDACCGRTWALKAGALPDLAPATRRAIHAASAVNTRGGFWSAIYSGSLTDELFLRLLRQMLKGRRRRVHLVLEASPAHRSSEVQRYVQSRKGRLTLHFLPEPSADLAPYHWI